MKERFSLLLLDEGELLLDDVAVECQREGPARAVQFAGPGRLKVGSRSIVFEPEDWRYPIARVPLRDASPVSVANSTSFRRQRRTSADAPARSHHRPGVPVLVLPADRGYVEQKKHGDSHPYRRARGPVVFHFLPLFSSLAALDRLVTQLYQVAHARDSTTNTLTQIVREKEHERMEALFDATTLEASFNSIAMPSPTAPSLDVPATLVHPLTKTIGRLWTTDKVLYFLPIHDGESAAQRYPFADMQNVRSLYYGKDDRALEISFRPQTTSSVYPRARQSLMFALDDHTSRDAAFLAIEGQFEALEAASRPNLARDTEAWQQGTLSNFGYIMALNFAAGRTFNDLSQYPVLPWVIADYTSNTLDLTDPSTFRDFTKPMAAMNPRRLAMFLERFESLPEEEPRFLCGTHYSCPSFVMSFLVRSAPDAMLHLQAGSFDAPDRTFFSIASSWATANSNSADVKELIPEFFAVDEGELPPECCVFLQNDSFQPGDFLVNTMGLDLGRRQDGRWIGDVELPPWANGSPETFVRLNRQALESDHVSSVLHAWIDCIFGVRSRSLEDGNLFYTDVLDKEGASNPDLDLDALYQAFGRTPRRLFRERHPARCATAGSPRPIFLAEAAVDGGRAAALGGSHAELISENGV